MDWIDLGYLGLFVATFLAATIIPFSSEITVLSMLYLGFHPILVVIIATLGNTSGGMTTYYLGYLGKTKWLEKYFKISHQKMYSWNMKVNRAGAYLALLTWLPIVGDLLSATLGFFKVNPLKVLAGMLLGRSTRFIVVAIFWKELYAYFN